MAKISGDKFVRRTSSMYGVEGDVVVILSADGIELKPRGGKLGLTPSGVEVAKAMCEPESVPAKYQHDPYGYLKFSAHQIYRRRAKRIEKQIIAELTTQLAHSQ